MSGSVRGNDLVTLFERQWHRLRPCRARRTRRCAQVVADPTRAFGAPIFERGGVRVDDVHERFWAGDPLDELSAEFGVPTDQLEDVLRVASRRAA